MNIATRRIAGTCCCSLSVNEVGGRAVEFLLNSCHRQNIGLSSAKCHAGSGRGERRGEVRANTLTAIPFCEATRGFLKWAGKTSARQRAGSCNAAREQCRCQAHSGYRRFSKPLPQFKPDAPSRAADAHVGLAFSSFGDPTLSPGWKVSILIGRRAEGDFLVVKNYIQPVAIGSAEGLVTQVYAQIKRDFGAIVAPFALHSPSPKLLAGAWMVCRETELVGNVRRSIKEAVAATVSKINQCPYCVDAHTIMLHATAEHEVARVISEESLAQISDPEIRAIVQWASATRSPGSSLLLSPPFSLQEAPEIIGTAVFYHYINRMVRVLLGETPLPSSRHWLRAASKRIAGWFFSRSVRRLKSPGESLRFLPEAELPADLAWAKTVPTIAEAFARFAAVMEDEGEHALSEEVRGYVEECVQTWNGEDIGMSRRWCEQRLNVLDDASKAAGRLALLTALAPYQVDERVVSDFRAYYPEDEILLGALAWASFTAARRIGTWLYAPTS